MRGCLARAPPAMPNRNTTYRSGPARWPRRWAVDGARRPTGIGTGGPARRQHRFDGAHPPLEVLAREHRGRCVRLRRALVLGACTLGARSCALVGPCALVLRVRRLGAPCALALEACTLGAPSCSHGPSLLVLRARRPGLLASCAHRPCAPASADLLQRPGGVLIVRQHADERQSRPRGANETSLRWPGRGLGPRGVRLRSKVGSSAADAARTLFPRFAHPG